MISLHSILAAGGLMESLPMIIFVVAGVLMALAFVMGFVKGFRKVKWDGLAWLVGGLAFVVVGYVFPIKGGTAAGSFWISLLVAVICAGGSFALFKVLAYFLRPKMRWIKDDINGDTSLAEFGLEFEPEYLDYDGEHDYQPYGKRIYKTGYGEPCFFFRLLGGIACAINVGIVLWALFSAFLLVVDVSALKTMAIGGIFNNEIVANTLFPLAKNYCLDYLAIGVMMLMAKQGYGRGLINSLRSIVITIGGFAAVGLSFYLPFSAFAAEGFLAGLVARCAAIFANLGALNVILGKLSAGIIILVIAVILLVVLNIVLKSICQTIENLGLTRELDSWLAAAVYLLIGAVICVGVWFVFASLDALGIFPFGAMIGDRGFFSQALYEYALSIVGPFFAKA